MAQSDNDKFGEPEVVDNDGFPAPEVETWADRVRAHTADLKHLVAVLNARNSYDEAQEVQTALITVDGVLNQLYELGMDNEQFPPAAADEAK